jgi:ATP-binding cassette subfamily C exporter for protease/lipase
VVSRKGLLAVAARRLRGTLLGVGLFSGLVNLLMLTGPMFMIQVYDRVLTSRSVPTLTALFALVVGLYLFLALFDMVRTRIMSRAGYWLEQEVMDATFRTYIFRGLSSDKLDYKPLNDLAAVRGWLGSPGPLAFFDLPWFPVFLAVVALMHPLLGLLACVGALVVVVLALSNQWATRGALGEATHGELHESRLASDSERNAEALVAMGMLPNVGARWRTVRSEAAAAAQRGGERAEVFSAASKSFRLLLQSAILGLGAWLAIGEQISPGMIVAASIIAGRALAPIDQVIGGWRATQRAWNAWRRLRGYLASDDRRAVGVPLRLSEPTGRVAVVGATKLPPSPKPSEPNPKAILSEITFDLQPGDGMGVIGPSASGKSTLAKLLVGVWMPDRGTIRLDGATYEQWPPEQIGPRVGYLPQQVELIEGTIAENIGRFDPNANDEAIVAAAQLANVHEMILSLPDGYGTRLDARPLPLSGGQLQRIALARAVFGDPCLLVLDEPNANLDAEGDAALAEAIRTMRARGCTVIVMAHRPSAITAVDLLLMLKSGKQIAFGPKADVLRRVTRREAPVAAVDGTPA